MKVEITTVRENALLERNKVEVELDHEGEATPSKEDVKDRLAAEKNLNVEEMEVDSINTGYGANVSKAVLKIYQDFEFDEDLEENPEETQVAERKEQQETVTVSEEYEEVVSGTISEAKNALGEMDKPDFEAALQAEKDNKDRKTLKEWLEGKIEG